MATVEENQQPLLPESDAPSTVSADGKKRKTPVQKAMKRTFSGTAHLANLLPTGTVLVFQIMSPVLTNQGRCPTSASHNLTLCLIVVSAISCFICSFTDSIRDSKGKVRYGFATFKGFYIMDASVEVSPEDMAKYRLRLIDFFHAIMTSLVFVTVALFDRNVVKCFYPSPSQDVRELLVQVPICFGIVCSLFFIAIPSKRHGIGFPLSRE